MSPRPLGSRYLLEDQIGQGGMGVVWRGRDRETGDYCAIKVLRPEFAADPGAVTRFVRERTALVKFRHPNVVSLRDMIVEGDYLALVMDFVEGGDLASYRRNRGGALPLGEALGMTAQICDALAAAHAAGIVHRDLKPANVLLDAGQVKLADFGIARIVGESPATTTGTVIGTVGFMAPEVIRGEQPTPACDVYAAGITLYELLTGVQPFTGQVVAIMHAHLESAPPRPAALPDRTWGVVSACLAKDPAARPSADGLARALRDPALLSEPWPSGQPVAAPGYLMTSGRAAPSPATGDPMLVSGAVAPRTPPEWTEAPGRPAAGETKAAAVGIGAAGSPPRPGGPGGHRGPGGRGTRPLWAAVAALALVFAGVAGAYLFVNGSGQPAGPQAVPPAASAQAVRPTTSASLSATKRAASHASSATPAAGPPSARATATAGAARAGTAPSPAPTKAKSTAVSGPAATPGPTGPDLVADGDFSDSSLSAWNHMQVNSAVVSGGMNGENAVEMTGNPTAGVAEIVSGLTPGKTYELTGWSLSDAGGTYIGVKEYDSTAGQSHINNTAAWAEVTITFTEGAGDTTADVFCWQSVTGVGYCSDVSLYALS